MYKEMRANMVLYPRRL